MGTRSEILIQHADGRFSSQYCHWDGYPTHNSRILLDHYCDDAARVALAGLGSLSSLDASPFDPPEGHTFDNAVKGYCVAYGRDRGEAEQEANWGPTLASVWPDGETWAEYVHVWLDGCWWVGVPGAGVDGLRLASDVLALGEEHANDPDQWSRIPPARFKALEGLARVMLAWNADAWDADEAIDGGDLVEAFAGWRRSLKLALEA